MAHNIPRAIVTSNPNAIHGTPQNLDARTVARGRFDANERLVAIRVNNSLDAFEPQGSAAYHRLLGQTLGLQSGGLQVPQAQGSLAASSAAATASAVRLAQSLVADNAQLPAISRGMCFEDLIAAVMIKVVEEEQKKITALIARLEGTNAAAPTVTGAAPVPPVAGTTPGTTPPNPTTGQPTPTTTAPAPTAAPTASAAGDSDSRQILFEQLKNEMNKLQQMQQALSNVLNTMHSGAMHSIDNIRA